MPIYYPLKYAIDNNSLNVDDVNRTVENLFELRNALDEQIPTKVVDGKLLLATWNIRDFDKNKYGYRTQESFSYIAEIINRFDLIAIQEVYEDLTALEKVMKLLGPWWDVIYTDETFGRRGNDERMAFVYDTRKVKFGNLAGELVIPTDVNKDLDPKNQLYRTPFIVGFKSGWFDFMLCTVHILYGASTANNPARVEEIELLASYLKKRSQSKHAWSRNIIALGDFNIFSTDDITFQKLVANDFRIPDAIQELPSNVAQKKHYDQIAFITPDIENQLTQIKAGIFNFFKYVYKEEDEQKYVMTMGNAYHTKSNGGPRENKKRYYKDWRTHQMSDHLPMWVELNTDFSEKYLKDIQS